MGTVHEDLCKFLIISCSILLRMRNVSDKICTKNQDTFLFNNFFSGNHAFYEIMCKKNVRARQVTDDSIMRHTHFSCQVTKATDTHLEYVILVAFPR
jgi:hypothetical protein